MSKPSTFTATQNEVLRKLAVEVHAAHAAEQPNGKLPQVAWGHLISVGQQAAGRLLKPGAGFGYATAQRLVVLANKRGHIKEDNVEAYFTSKGCPSVTPPPEDDTDPLPERRRAIAMARTRPEKIRPSEQAIAIVRAMDVAMYRTHSLRFWSDQLDAHQREIQKSLTASSQLAPSAEDAAKRNEYHKELEIAPRPPPKSRGKAPADPATPGAAEPGARTAKRISNLPPRQRHRKAAGG